MLHHRTACYNSTVLYWALTQGQQCVCVCVCVCVPSLTGVIFDTDSLSHNLCPSFMCTHTHTTFYLHLMQPIHTHTLFPSLFTYPFFSPQSTTQHSTTYT